MTSMHVFLASLNRQIAKTKELIVKNPTIHALEALDAVITLDDLETAITNAKQNRITMATCKPFVALLDSRWRRINNSDLIYFIAHELPTNQLCYFLAATLIHHCPQLGSIIQLLMPTLKSVRSDVTTTDFTKEFSLWHVLPSDDNCYLIEVYECLQLAEEDATLKHTSLINNTIKNLSEAEQARVIYHSASTTNYYEAIQERHHYRSIDQSVNAYIHRLAIALRKGGTVRNCHASDRNAGAEANLGIKAFADFVSKLGFFEKRRLFGLTAPGILTVDGKRDQLGTIWERLYNPIDEKTKQIIHSDKQSSLYCVETVADELNRILDSNYEILTAWYPSFTKQCTTLKLTDTLNQKSHQTQTALALPTYHVQSTYYRGGWELLAERMLIDHDHSTMITNMATSNAMPDLIAKLANQLNPDSRIIFVCRFYKRFADDYFSHFSAFNVLRRTLKPDQQMTLLAAATPKQLKKLLHHFDHLLQIIPESIRDAHRAITICKMVILSHLDSMDKLLMLCRKLPQTAKETIFSWLGLQTLIEMLLSSDLNVYELQELAGDAYCIYEITRAPILTYLTKIGAARVANKIDNKNDFLALYNLFNHSDKLNFIVGPGKFSVIKLRNDDLPILARLRWTDIATLSTNILFQLMREVIAMRHRNGKVMFDHFELCCFTKLLNDTVKYELMDLLPASCLQETVTTLQELVTLLTITPSSSHRLILTKLTTKRLHHFFFIDSTFDDSLEMVIATVNRSKHTFTTLYAAFTHAYLIHRELDLREYTSSFGRLFGSTRGEKIAGAKKFGEIVVTNKTLSDFKVEKLTLFAMTHNKLGKITGAYHRQKVAPPSLKLRRDRSAF